MQGVADGGNIIVKVDPDAGYTDIRPGHGCVFGTIEPQGSRLTDLAQRARMTKQSVGEATSDLEQRGYVERVPDPTTAAPRSSGSPSAAARRRPSGGD